MPFIPHTDDDTREMLDAIGEKSLDDLFDEIPKDLIIDSLDGVPEAMQPSLALDHLGQMIEAQANTLGFQDGFMLIAAVFICALFPAWILGRTQKDKNKAPAAGSAAARQPAR